MPTPLLDDLSVDEPSVRRCVEHQIAFGASGLLLAGTCGEGAWLRDRDREALVRTALDCAAGRIRVAVQVTDNSASRVLDNIDRAAEWGAEIAVVAAPYFALNPTPARIQALYAEVARASCLPVGYYDRGTASPYGLPEGFLAELLEEPGIVMVKDSSRDPGRRQVFLAARERRPGLVLLNGDEFDCVSCLAAGYDGLLLGGGIFNAGLAGGIDVAVRAGDLDEARRLQARMNDLMYRVYGGTEIECWLSGLKELLVRMGLFSTRASHLGYPLTESCRNQIRDALSGADGMGFPADLFRGRVADPGGDPEGKGASATRRVVAGGTASTAGGRHS